MKKFVPLFFSVLLVVCGCTTSNEESSGVPLSDKGIHFAPDHGGSNIPMSIFKEEDIYHLFYSTGDKKWGHQTSPNLIHWEWSGTYDVPTSAVADLISYKTSEDSVFVRVLFFEDDGVEAAILQDGEWKEFELELDSKAKGIPKVNKGQESDWIMTVTNEDVVEFHTSTDLKSWRLINSISNQYDATYTEVAIIEETPFLITDGYRAQILMEKTNEGFTTIREPRLMANQASGTFYQIDDLTFVTYSLDNKLFSTPLAASLTQSEKISFAPSKLLRNQVLAKRRGRLSNLVGDDLCTWFSFEIDSINSASNITLKNELEDQIDISLKRKNNILEIVFGDVSESLAAGTSQRLMMIPQSLGQV